MEFVQRIFLYVSVTALLGLIVGLFRPWIVLWWEDTQNRKKVFQLYGAVAAVTYLIYRILLLI